jgi:hypothetical protein
MLVRERNADTPGAWRLRLRNGISRWQWRGATGSDSRKSAEYCFGLDGRPQGWDVEINIESIVLASHHWSEFVEDQRGLQQVRAHTHTNTRTMLYMIPGCHGYLYCLLVVSDVHRCDLGCHGNYVMLCYVCCLVLYSKSTVVPKG